VGLGPEPGHFYVAAMDPATRGDAWTLVVATRLAGGKLAVVMARQWQATRGAPLSPDDVLREIAEELRPYNVARVATDQWAADALADIGSRYGLCVASEAITASRKVELFETMRALVLSGGVELPPVRELLEDIRRVRKKVTQNGITIDLPRAAGRHCDYAFAAALALAQPMGEPIAGAHLLQDGWEPWELAEAEKMERKLRGDDDNGDAESELTEWD
jgi:hypothetical protein